MRRKRKTKKNGKKVHSTQKPEALLHRIILATTNKDDTILDPFLGTGTTAAVAKKLGRKYFGIEKDKKSFKAASDRIKNCHLYTSTSTRDRTRARMPSSA